MRYAREVFEPSREAGWALLSCPVTRALRLRLCETDEGLAVEDKARVVI